MDKATTRLGVLLVLYLLLVGSCSAAFILIDFPVVDVGGKLTFHFGETEDQGLFLLAMAAGLAGSFIHGAQSLSSYLGNEEFKRSWAPWYFMRPWIGAILGLTIYVAFRAGLMGGGGTMNPHGVVAVGLLGGWFSKTTTDKMQEVFATLFKTDADKARDDKLQAKQPKLDRVEPSPVPAFHNDVTLHGDNFMDGTVVIINGQELPAAFVDRAKLQVSLTGLAGRPLNKVPLRVKNPRGVEPSSNVVNLDIL